MLPNTRLLPELQAAPSFQAFVVRSSAADCVAPGRLADEGVCGEEWACFLGSPCLGTPRPLARPHGTTRTAAPSGSSMFPRLSGPEGSGVSPACCLPWPAGSSVVRS